MVKISLKDLKVEFEQFTALHNISFEIPEGKITTLLGPSGCGKTTTLRSIAGFNFPTGGQILFDDKDVVGVPPQKRDTGFVFQNYALWPHMSVYHNIAFGLKLRKIPKEEIKEKVTRVANLMSIGDQLEKNPSELSGGQQQRVALARALVIEPSVLLFDEPLSNLDAKLRMEMRVEIKKLVNELKLTAVYVTHDQEEALSLSDIIIVMEKGKILQIGSPVEIYTDPETLFVATFMGYSSHLIANVIEGDKFSVETKFGQIITLPLTERLEIGSTVDMILRPEYINPHPDTNHIAFEGKYYASSYLGPMTRIQIELPDKTILHYDKEGLPDKLDVGGKGKVGISPDKILVFQNGIRVR